ncbi:MAG: hypothetical protein WA081_04775 [Desulfosalsimonadaceae bacterium]
MPTNRTRKARCRKASIPLDESIINYLLWDEEPEKGTPGYAVYIDRYFDGSNMAADIWAEHGETLRKLKKQGRKAMTKRGD